MTFTPDVISLSPNHSPGQPSGKKVVVHATRSGISMNPREFEGTLNHFANPASEVSAHGLVGRDGRIARIVPDSQTAWHAAVRYPDGRVIEHNTTCWGWELEQGVESDGFTIKQMESWAVVARHYVVEFGVKPQHITDITKSGFIGHQETPQGIAVGKSDPGSQFMWQAFIASLEDDMALSDEDKRYLAGLAREIVGAISTGRMSNRMLDGAGDYTEVHPNLNELKAGTGATADEVVNKFKERL